MNLDAEDRDVDVVVVGAGPAGTTTAKYAAMNGARVLVVEKRQDIGSPVRCGEGIARIWLDKVGVKPRDEWISNQVKGARIFSSTGKVFAMDETLAGNECGYVVRRDIFDKFLAKEAIKHGAELMVKTQALSLLRKNGEVVGVRAIHMGKEFDITAKVVVGADGFESLVGRWAGINTSIPLNDINSCFQYHLVGINCSKDFNDFYITSKAKGGYIWVFAKGDDEANVGIGLMASESREPGFTKKILDEFIAENPDFSSGKAIEEVAGAVSVCKPIEETVTDHVVLVGDAARQIDPLTGGGVVNAMIAGKIAGEVIAKALKENDFSKGFLMKYDEGWRDEIEEKLYANYKARESLLSLSDETVDKIIDSLQGVMLDKITTENIIEAVLEKHPELEEELMEKLLG